MSPIRCPQCGMINEPGDVGFPRCGQCHTDLQRCDTCRHFGEQTCAHPRGRRYFTSDLEGAKVCPAFVSRHAAPGPRMKQTLPAPIWVSLLLIIMLAGIGAATWFIDPIGRYFTGNPLRLETSVPHEVVQGQPFVITMRVTNLLSVPSTHLYLEVDDVFLASAEPGPPFPEPLRMRRDRNHLLLEYDPLPANGQRVLQLTFIPHRLGIAPFQAKIYAPSNQLRHEISLPIIVRDAGLASSLRAPAFF